MHVVNCLDYGTGFMISKGIKQNLISYKIVNERICTVRMRGRFFNTTFISIHTCTYRRKRGRYKRPVL
jgi:hypothetical protein